MRRPSNYTSLYKISLSLGICTLLSFQLARAQESRTPVERLPEPLPDNTSPGASANNPPEPPDVVQAAPPPESMPEDTTPKPTPAPAPYAKPTPLPRKILAPKTMSEREITKLNTDSGDPGTQMDLRMSRQLRNFCFALTLDTPEQAANPVIAQTLPPYKEMLDHHVKIPSIHEVVNDPTYFNPGTNDAFVMELKYLNWGAVNSVGFRIGDYYTATIGNYGQIRPLTAVFQYRQLYTQETIRTLTQAVPKVSMFRAARAYFAIIGPPYRSYGPVTSWRLLILDGNTIVAKEQSAIW